MKYRTIQPREVRIGDEYRVKGAPQSPWTRVNALHGWEDCDWAELRRAIPGDNWISFKDRQPTKEDASLSGHVVATSSGGKAISLHDFELCQYFEYWMPLNFIPREATPVKVDGKEIIPQKDGSVKLSCGTVIPKADVKEFIRQYQERIKG